MASILPSLHREDRALVAWYLSLYAPRAGGAYDSHHRTAEIAGRTRRRGGCVAAHSTRAAGGASAADRSAHEPEPGQSGCTCPGFCVHAGTAGTRPDHRRTVLPEPLRDTL